jgi:Flp pilus assembly protein TadD
MFLAQGQLRHWQNTQTLYRNAIRVAAEHPLPYKGLAMYLINNKRPQEAIPYFEKAIALAEDDHRLHNSLGVAYDVLGKRQDAEKEYLRALQLNPAHAPAHNNLGLLYLRQSKYDDAIKHLREAVSLRPDLAGAHFYLAEVLKQKGFGKEAAFHYKAAGRLDSHYRRFDLAI